MTMAGRPLEFTIYEFSIFRHCHQWQCCQRYSHKRRHAGDQWPVHVTLDFGSGVFTGNARWLEIAVRTNGASGFVTLTPRQPLTPTPLCHPGRHGRGLVRHAAGEPGQRGGAPRALPAAVMTEQCHRCDAGRHVQCNATTATTLGSLATNTAPSRSIFH